MFLPLYETDAGRKVYEETLACVRKNFPQYLSEMEGTADGAGVPFHKVNLYHFSKHHNRVPLHIVASSLCYQTVCRK